MTDETKIRKIREKAQNKQKNTKKFFAVAFILCLAVFSVFVFLKLFVIKKTEVIMPENTFLTADAVISKTGVKTGDNLLLASKKEIEKNLTSAYPYIKSVKVEKKFPSSLRISLELNSPAMRIEIGGKNFVLSSDGKVLFSLEEDSEILSRTANLVTQGVTKCVQGEKIGFKDKDSLKIVTDIYQAFEKYSLSDKLTYIDITDKYNIKLQLDERLDIVFGTFDNVEAKVEMLSLDYEKEFQNLKAKIDISDGKDAFVYVYGS